MVTCEPSKLFLSVRIRLAAPKRMVAMKNLKTLAFISMIVPLVSFMVLSNATADDKNSKRDSKKSENRYDSRDRDDNRNYNSQDSKRYYDPKTNKYYDSRDNQYRYNRTDKDYRRTDQRYYNYKPYRGLSSTHRRGNHAYHSGQRYYYRGTPHRYLGHYNRNDWYSGPRRTYPVGKYYYDTHNQLMFSYSEGGAWFSISIGD